MTLPDPLVRDPRTCQRRRGQGRRRFEQRKHQQVTITSVPGGVTGLLDAALAYAARGWPVFPCKPGRKTPLTDHGFENASTDPATITAWWRATPAANVAVPTGTLSFDVLDVDRKPGGDGFAALGRLQRAGLVTGANRLIRTRSGGLHIYFAGTDQRCGALKRHFLDFQAAGGYVLMPPSWVAEDDTGPPGRYELLDERHGSAVFDWTAAKQLLDPPRKRPPVRASTWTGGQLPPSVEDALTASATDRSAALHRLVGACFRAGLDDAAIHQLAAGYQPALEKYGDQRGQATSPRRVARRLHLHLPGQDPEHPGWRRRAVRRGGHTTTGDPVGGTGAEEVAQAKAAVRHRRGAAPTPRRHPAPDPRIRRGDRPLPRVEGPPRPGAGQPHGRASRGCQDFPPRHVPR